MRMRILVYQKETMECSRYKLMKMSTHKGEHSCTCTELPPPNTLKKIISICLVTYFDIIEPTPEETTVSYLNGWSMCKTW